MFGQHFNTKSCKENRSLNSCRYPSGLKRLRLAIMIAAIKMFGQHFNTKSCKENRSLNSCRYPSGLKRLRLAIMIAAKQRFTKQPNKLYVVLDTR